MFLNNIFHDYALLTTPRDTIFGMYTQITARNDIRYILYFAFYAYKTGKVSHICDQVLTAHDHAKWSQLYVFPGQIRDSDD